MTTKEGASFNPITDLIEVEYIEVEDQISKNVSEAIRSDGSGYYASQSRLKALADCISNKTDMPMEYITYNIKTKYLAHRNMIVAWDRFQYQSARPRPIRNIKS